MQLSWLSLSLLFDNLCSKQKTQQPAGQPCQPNNIPGDLPFYPFECQGRLVFWNLCLRPKAYASQLMPNPVRTTKQSINMQHLQYLAKHILLAFCVWLFVITALVLGWRKPLLDTFGMRISKLSNLSVKFTSLNSVSTLRGSDDNSKGRCLIRVIQLAGGILLLNFRMTRLLCNLQVHFDCARSQKVCVPLL